MNTDTLLTPFLNRDAEFKAADWFQLVPKGTFLIRRKEADGKVKLYEQVVDDVAVGKIVQAFTNRRAADPNYKLLIGFEHYAHNPQGSTEAACWGEEMDARADGVWARGEWSDTGEAAIRNRRYRYLSPVWFPHQTESLGGNRFRPTEVNDAGLTNKPNLGAALQPFWNREITELNGREATTEQPDTKDTMKEKLIALLGLAADAGDDAILTAVTALKKDKETQAGEATAFKNRLTTLETAHKALLGDAVTRELAANKDVIPEGQVEAWKNRLESDFTGTSELLRGIKRPEVTTKTPVHQPGKGAAASAKKTDGEGDQHPFLNRVDELMKADAKLTRADAFLKAADDNELYEGYLSGITGRE
ncbi:Mu-like prophage I protein [Opitutaceae bacterium TAV1]|nr:Mu-like prophage I protein [Opitutaceae bacterium TAV1]